MICRLRAKPPQIDLPPAVHNEMNNRTSPTNAASGDRASKVPEVALVFWIIKIAATTLGETGGDAVTMTLDWGYLAGTALFLSALVVLVAI